MRAIILGCSGSSGVPEIGCECGVCTSTHPKNKRSRVSVFVEINGVNLLMDTSPDLRTQSIENKINGLNAVLYTHDHADHTGGLDDLRGFNKLSDASIPVYGNEATLHAIQRRFPYAFGPNQDKLWYKPSLEPHPLIDAPIHEFIVAGVPITAFQQIHGKTKTLGYRIENFAYSTDCNDLPETAFEALEGVDVWVVDCLRYTPSHSHSHVELTLRWAERVKPKLTILTHMAHELDYETLAQELPPGVVPGYDGMVIDL